MICPICKGADARRSRRQSTTDYVLNGLGIYPWRCRECRVRFYARLMPLSDSLHAHCPICGNLDLKRIAAEHVDSPMAFLWRWLQIPAYRCEPCRHKYFSLLPQMNARRPLRQFTPADRNMGDEVPQEQGPLKITASSR